MIKTINIKEYIMKKEEDFKDLLILVNKCKKCEKMKSQIKVLSERNGNINSKLLFIAEAPGRLGAARTGIPLHGDKTGDNFEELIKHIGLKRDEIFITNSILCNPQVASSSNGSPTSTEIRNCSEYLRKTIEIVNPEVIVTLGKKALFALKNIEKHNYKFNECIAKKKTWNSKILFPLYHPSPTVINIYRSLKEQKKDFKVLELLVKSLNSNKK